VARETSGSPTPPPQSITVQDAIEEAPATELKRLMQRVVTDVPEARTLIEAALLRPLGDGGGESTTGLKRKATEECKNCKQFYQVEDNRKGVCRYHPCKFHLIISYWQAKRLPQSPGQRNQKSTTTMISGQTTIRKIGGILKLSWTIRRMRRDTSCPVAKQMMTEPGCVVSRHKPKVDSLGYKRMRRDD
jgi:hypothetical protein